jgi:hypothetical protein
MRMKVDGSASELERVDEAIVDWTTGLVRLAIDAFTVDVFNRFSIEFEPTSAVVNGFVDLVSETEPMGELLRSVSDDIVESTVEVILIDTSSIISDVVMRLF